MQGEILRNINGPADLKKLSEDELVMLCEELRRFIIDSVCCNPGHFGASLGVVELTVALHRVFDTPYDKLIWDVGHQAYAHKILTGRRDSFSTNRRYKGISGFPRMSESPYDAFGTGHSSTSISAALGMAVASSLKHENRHHIAVIGDGSMTAGLAFEGLNNAGVANANILVILNDNGIAIDQNVGALKEYLTDITTSKTYNRIKDEIWNLLGFLNKLGPDARGLVQKLDNAVKAAMLQQSNLFEALNFRYFGPLDGHNLLHLTGVLEDLKNIQGPKLLHVVTRKGKGFSFAEKDQTRFHAPGRFNKETGELTETPCEKDKPPKYQTVFGQTVLELARQNPAVVGITPAMPTGCSLNIMMAEMPHRAFDVGIAEQHAVTFAAGLAAAGMIPYCNIYSSFLQRAFDQVVHDVALQNLQVVFCVDRAGLVGEDGATHHGAYDLSFLRCIPNLIIAAPLNEEEMRNMMFTAQLLHGRPFVIRYPRSNGVLKNWQTPMQALEIGKGQRLCNGRNVAILSIGHVGNAALEVCNALQQDTGLQPACFDMRFVKPLDEQLLHDVCTTYSCIVTIEDNALAGGFGSAVLEFLSDNGYSNRVVRLGIPDKFVEHGSVNELQRECYYDYHALYKEVKDACLAFQKEKGKRKSVGIG